MLIDSELSQTTETSPHNIVLDECDKLLAACQGRQILPASEVMNFALDISQAVRRSNDRYQELLSELADIYEKYNDLLSGKYNALLDTVGKELLSTPNT